MLFSDYATTTKPKEAKFPDQPDINSLQSIAMLHDNIIEDDVSPLMCGVGYKYLGA